MNEASRIGQKLLPIVTNFTLVSENWANQKLWSVGDLVYPIT